MKSYAAIFPCDGRMLILYKNDGKKDEIVELKIKKVTEITSSYDFDELHDVFSVIKSTLDETIISICICISSDFKNNKNTLISTAKHAGLNNFEVVEEHKVKSLPAILEAGYKLEDEKIIWQYSNKYCNVWDGKHFVEHNDCSDNDLFEGLLITTKHPPDILLCEKSSIVNFDSSFVNELFPDCKIVECELKNEINAALTYAQEMENIFVKEESAANNEKIFECKRNGDIPATNINVAINISQNNASTIQATYYFKKIPKTFAIKTGIILPFNRIKIFIDINKRLNNAEIRLNGKFEYVCVSDYYFADIVWKKWATKKGFKNLKIFGHQEELYMDAIFKLPIETKSSDIIWVQHSRNNFQIWQNYAHQKYITVDSLKQTLPTSEHIPSIILYDEEQNTQDAAELKNYFPENKYFGFVKQWPSNQTLLKYMQIMAEKAVLDSETFLTSSYAAVFPFDGSMVVLQVNDTKRDITEYPVAKVSPKHYTYEINEMFYNVKARLDDESIKAICVCVPSTLEEDTKNEIIKAAEIKELKDFEIIEEYKIISLQAILQNGYDLKGNEIIWTCINDYCCIWDGTLLEVNSNSFDERTFKGLLIATKFPPDILVFGKGTACYQEEVLNLFPNCKIVNYQSQNIKDAAIHYAQMMYSQDLKAVLKNTDDYKKDFKCDRNTNQPEAEIYVGISELLGIVSALYYSKEASKEFTLKINTSLSSFEQKKEMAERLKIAVARVNGKLEGVCIVKHLDDITFDNEWATQCGFKKVEKIEKRKADYLEAIAQLSLNIKNDHIIWMSKTYDCYEIWHGYDFQSEISVSKEKSNLFAGVRSPDYIIFKEKASKSHRENLWKKNFPKCQFLLCNCQHTYTTLLKYAQKVASDDSVVKPEINDIPTANHDFDEKNVSRQENQSLTDEKDISMNEFVTQLVKNDIPAGNHEQENEKFVSEPESEPLTPTSNEKVTSLKSKFEKLKTCTKTDGISFTFPKQSSKSNDHHNVVGIDLGTSRCCAAVNRNNVIKTVHLDNKGERLLPSYIGYDEDEVKCGNVVVNRLRHVAKSIIFDSKRIIGRNFNDIEIDSIWPFGILEKNKKVVMEIRKSGIILHKSAEEVCADLLKYIKHKVEEFQGAKLTDAVITVPAAFNSLQNEATIRAAKLAGWDAVTLLPEPVAAAFAYFIERPIPNNSIVLVFDFGGGTLDVCIFKIANNKIQIISNTGDTKLGGRDFDTVLFNYFKNQLDVNYGITLIKDKKYKLILECQRIKEDLSTATSCFLSVDEFNPDMHEIIPLQRKEFEKITKPLLNKIRNTLLSAIHHSRYNENDINKILLVGGGSRMPMLKELLQEVFPQAEHCCEEHPDEVVAIGAAYYASNRENSLE